MKTKIVSLKTAKKLAENNFTARTLYHWKITKNGKIKIVDRDGISKKKIMSMEEVAALKIYPAYTLEELLYGIYSRFALSQFAANEIPMLIINICIAMENPKQRKKIAANPAEYLGKQILKAIHENYLTNKVLK